MIQILFALFSQEEYLNVAGQSQEMVDQIASDFEKYSDYLKNIVEDKEVPTPNISPINSEALNSLIEKELKLTQKVRTSVIKFFL